MRAHTHAVFKIVHRLNVESPMMNANADDAVLSSASVNDLYVLVFFLWKLRMQVAHNHSSLLSTIIWCGASMCWVAARSDRRTPPPPTTTTSSKYSERMRNTFSNIALNFTWKYFYCESDCADCVRVRTTLNLYMYELYDTYTYLFLPYSAHVFSPNSFRMLTKSAFAI